MRTFNNYNILQQSDSVRPQYKTVDLSEIELPDVDTNNNTLLLEVSPHFCGKNNNLL